MTSSTRKRRLKRLVLVVLIVVLPQLFFQLHVVEGPSMWPAFNDGVEREWVISLRDWVAAEPQVYDVLVIDDPENDGGQVLKRVVALPGDYPNIMEGDVRIRSMGLDNEWHLRRTLEQILETRVPFLSLEDLRQRAAGAGWELMNDRHRCIVPMKGACSLAENGTYLKLEPEDGECVLRIPEKSITDDHKSTTNRLVKGEHVVRDIVVTFSIFELERLAAGTSVEVRHHLGDSARPAAALSVTAGDAAVVLRLIGGVGDVFETTLPRSDGLDFRLVAVDDRLALMVRDRQVESSFRLLQERSRRAASGPPESYLNLLVQGGSAILSRLDIDRDIHYTSTSDQGGDVQNPSASGEAQVDRGKYYLLGDNSPESRDSRHWRTPEPYHVVGRPILVVWPWSRIRRLP